MVTRTAERRPLGALGRMGVVAALHVGVLFVIARSLGLAPSIEPPPPMVTDFIDEVRPPEELVPPPEVVLPRQNTVFLPEPNLPPIAADPAETITGPPPDDTLPPPTSTIVTGPKVVGVQTDSRYPLTRPPYSARMIREGNEGAIDLEVYVLPNGRVGDARVVKSTGFEELDLAALAEAKRNWRLQPATRDGVPYAQWHRLRVTFKLNQR